MKLYEGIWNGILNHLRYELAGAAIGLGVLFLKRLLSRKKQQGVSMDIVRKEFLEGVKLSAEIKDGKFILSGEAALTALVQLADDKIENPIVSGFLQAVKAVVGKL